MSIQSKIDEDLWEVIQDFYESRQYTAAIVNTIYYLADIIREKSGLLSDGVALIDQAFGGASPKIKITNLSNETENDIQKGIASILRGIFQLIRNPRSHGRIEDTQSEADSIILFIDYLLCIIIKSKGIFSIEEHLKRVFDKGFVVNDKYTQLLIKEIPEKKRLQVAMRVYADRENGDGEKLKHYMKELLRKMTEEEIAQLYSIISEELKYATEHKVIRTMLQIMPIEYWSKLEESVKIRTESMILESVDEGKYDSRNNKLLSGGLGTWAVNRMKYFQLQDDFLEKILWKLLFDDTSGEDYVFHYFIYEFSMLCPQVDSRLLELFTDYLNKGEKRIYNVLNRLFNRNHDHPWKEALAEVCNNFKEAAPASEPDLGNLTIDDILVSDTAIGFFLCVLPLVDKLPQFGRARQIQSAHRSCSSSFDKYPNSLK